MLSPLSVTETVGRTVSTVNVFTDKGVLELLVASVTVIVQFEYVASESVLNVIVLGPVVADVVELPQEPPYVIVPASFDVKI